MLRAASVSECLHNLLGSCVMELFDTRRLAYVEATEIGHQAVKAKAIRRTMRGTSGTKYTTLSRTELTTPWAFSCALLVRVVYLSRARSGRESVHLTRADRLSSCVGGARLILPGPLSFLPIRLWRCRSLPPVRLRSTRACTSLVEV